MEAKAFGSSDSQRQNVPYIHKVGIPPKQDLLKEFKTTVKETLFSDDPLRSFKDQPKSRQLMLALQAIFPILDWGRSYNLKKFRGDLISGLTIASLCIPQVLYNIFQQLHFFKIISVSNTRTNVIYLY